MQEGRVRTWRTRFVACAFQTVSEDSGAAGGVTFGLRGAERRLAGALRAAFLATFLVAPRFLAGALRVAFRATFFEAVLRVALRATLRVAFFAADFFAADFLVADFFDAVLRVPFFAAAFFAGLRFVVAFAILSPLDPDCRNVALTDNRRQ